MTEPFFTIVAVFIVGASIILFVWGVFRVLLSVSRPVIRSFWYPLRDRTVTVEFKEEPWAGTHIDIARCTAFTPSEKVCLRLKKLAVSGLPRPRDSSPRGRPTELDSPKASVELARGA